MKQHHTCANMKRNVHLLCDVGREVGILNPVFRRQIRFCFFVIQGVQVIDSILKMSSNRSQRYDSENETDKILTGFQVGTCS